MVTIISIFEHEIGKLKDAVLSGIYGTRSIAGDAVINLNAALSLLKEQNLQQQDSADNIYCQACRKMDDSTKIYCMSCGKRLSR